MDIEPSNKRICRPFPTLFGFRAIFTQQVLTAMTKVFRSCCYSYPLGTTACDPL
jgi:hypothetical protein